MDVFVWEWLNAAIYMRFPNKTKIPLTLLFFKSRGKLLCFLFYFEKIHTHIKANESAPRQDTCTCSVHKQNGV